MAKILTRQLPLDASKCADFAARRLRRIVPLYLFTILVVLLMAAVWFLRPADCSRLVDETLKPLVFAANMPSADAVEYLHMVSTRSLAF